MRTRVARSVIDWALAAALFLVPLLYSRSLFYYSYQMPKALVLRLALGVILVCGAIVLFGVRRRVAVRPADVLLAAFLAWLGLSALLSPWPVAALLGTAPRFEGWMGFVGYAVFFWAASQGGRRRLTLALGAFAISGSLVGVLALIELAGWIQPLGAGSFGVRAIATMGNPLFLGSLLCLGVPLAAGAYLLARTPRERLGALVVLACQGVGLIATFSRGALLGAGLGTAVGIALLFRYAPESRRRISRSAVALLTLTVLGLGIVGVAQPEARQTAVRRVTELLQPGEGSAGSRLANWSTTVDLISRNPVFGHGLDTFQTEFLAVRPQRMIEIEGAASPDRPHNHWLYLAYAGGVPAVGLYAAFLTVLLLAGFAALRRRPGWRSCVVLATLMAATVAHEVEAFFGFSMPWSAPIAAVIEGGLLLASVSVLARSDGEKEPAVIRAIGTVRGAALPGLALVLLVLCVPFFVDGYRQTYADLLFKQGDRNPALALSKAERAVSLSPRDATYGRTLGLLYENAGAGDPSYAAKALQTYERTLSSAPWSSDIAYLRASLLRNMGQAESAQTAYTEIVDRDPYHSGALADLATILLRQRRASDAVPLARRLTIATPGQAQSWVILGFALEGAGDLSGAVEAYRRAVTVDPADPRALEALERLGGL